MAGVHTLNETERQVETRLGSKSIDFAAMAVSSNLFRAATAVRNHLERSVLAKHDLSWTAFVVLWVTWIWEPIETRQIAEEGGFSKATLTGVLGTLESRGLLKRSKSKDDGRLVIVKLTPSGRKLMDKLFPEFNREEKYVVESLSSKATQEVADHLREITRHLES
ncbi:MAG: MarR family winged helix-turn-helix transcriptional regulator [Microbacteriaceae bacterium]